MDRLPANQEEYGRFLAELKQRIGCARITASRSVNKEMVLLYWDIGRCIVTRQQALGWGESIIDRLSADLRSTYPGSTGYSPRNLRNMKQFYQEYSAPAVWQQPVAKLESPRTLLPSGSSDKTGSPGDLPALLTEVPWGHHVLVLNMVKEPLASAYYLRATAQLGWSRNVLLNQIRAQTYERAIPEEEAGCNSATSNRL